MFDKAGTFVTDVLFKSVVGVVDGHDVKVFIKEERTFFVHVFARGEFYQPAASGSGHYFSYNS